MSGGLVEPELVEPGELEPEELAELELVEGGKVNSQYVGETREKHFSESKENQSIKSTPFTAPPAAKSQHDATATKPCHCHLAIGFLLKIYQYELIKY